MEDKTVIITTLNEAWAAPNTVIDLFLESFRTGQGISNTSSVVCAKTNHHQHAPQHVTSAR